MRVATGKAGSLSPFAPAKAGAQSFGSARVWPWGPASAGTNGERATAICCGTRRLANCYITPVTRTCDLPAGQGKNDVTVRRPANRLRDRPRRIAMHVIRRRGWEIPERCATPEHLFFDRRAFLAATGAAALALTGGAAQAQRVADLPDPTASLYPVTRNEKYALDRPLTDEKINANYNN